MPVSPVFFENFRYMFSKNFDDIFFLNFRKKLETFPGKYLWESPFLLKLKAGVQQLSFEAPQLRQAFTNQLFSNVRLCTPILQYLFVNVLTC